ncbi:MAG: OmpA family protein [Oleiphilaceae bacterium]|nr:OmpA family protein [Oleiphilaceae bacterium]
MMRKLALAAAVSGVLMSSHTVVADGHGERSTVEAYLGAAQTKFDSDRNFDDMMSVEGGLELPLTDALSLEGWLGMGDTEVEGTGVEPDTEKYSLGLLYHFSNEATRPFVSLGAAHFEIEPPTGDANDESLAQLGLGIKHYYDNNVIMRAEALAMNSIDNEVTDYALRVAIGYAFGRDSKPAPAPAPVVERAPEPKPVPAPQPEPVVKAEPMPEPSPAPKPMPAPVDTDGDGVFDKDDQCADTPAQFKVDAAGCPIMLMEKVSIELRVNFRTNSADISPESFAEIKQVADFMNQYDGTKVTVEGHTDDRGRAAYNKSLSQKRADAVKQVLIKEFRIAPERIDAIGYGEERPIADNNTAEGRALNRRVVGVIEALEKRAATK